MDKETINRKYFYLIEKFDKSKKYLEKYYDVDEENKEVYFDALQRTIEEVLESAIKINIFILKQKDIFPKTYYDSFEQLKTELNLEEDEFEIIANSAKFKNILAHEYMQISTKFTMEKIEKIINYYPKYLKQLKKLLK